MHAVPHCATVRAVVHLLQGADGGLFLRGTCCIAAVVGYCPHAWVLGPAEPLASFQICKFWDNDPTKEIYHCADCGICRFGRCTLSGFSAAGCPRGPTTLSS